MAKAGIEVDTSQLRNLVTQAKAQMESVENTLDQIEEAAKNLPITVSNIETGAQPLGGVGEPHERRMSEATIEAGTLPREPVRLEWDRGHLWLYPNEDGKTVRIETEAKA